MAPILWRSWKNHSAPWFERNSAPSVTVPGCCTVYRVPFTPLFKQGGNRWIRNFARQLAHVIRRERYKRDGACCARDSARSSSVIATGRAGYCATSRSVAVVFSFRTNQIFIVEWDGYLHRYIYYNEFGITMHGNKMYLVPKDWVKCSVFMKEFLLYICQSYWGSGVEVRRCSMSQKFGRGNEECTNRDGIAVTRESYSKMNWGKYSNGRPLRIIFILMRSLSSVTSCYCRWKLNAAFKIFVCVRDKI